MYRWVGQANSGFTRFDGDGSGVVGDEDGEMMIMTMTLVGSGAKEKEKTENQKSFLQFRQEVLLRKGQDGVITMNIFHNYLKSFKIVFCRTLNT